MEKSAYPIVVHALCEEDGGGFLALAPDLVGCMGDGASEAEAIACLRDAMDEWADEMKALGRDIPEPFSLAAKIHEEEDALRRLVTAQAELIKKHEEALDKQNASLEDLRHTVSLLSDGLAPVTLEKIAHHRCGALKLWSRDAVIVGPRISPVVIAGKRTSISSH